jgi:hypothetical protein
MTLDLYAPTEPVAKQQTEEKLIINGNLAANACTTYRKVTGDACADSCLGTTVGVCPVSLVVKGGDLTKGTCEDVGYTHANGTVSQKAGPCGTLVFKEYTKAAGNYLRSASRSSNHREADTTISTFNYTKCPSSYELWATNTADPTKVPRTFNLSKFAPTAPAGFQYYELAFHDWTQKPLCPGIKCVGSYKSFDPVKKIINDTFSTTCVGHQYQPALRFNFTDTPGRLLGFWDGIPGPKKGWIPDTIVDFELTKDGEGYDWVLEMQCVEKFNHVEFVGLNFYSRQQTPGKIYIDNMLQVARDRGLGIYMDHGEKVTIVDQENCSYPHP